MLRFVAETMENGAETMENVAETIENGVVFDGFGGTHEAWIRIIVLDFVKTIGTHR